MATLPLSQRTGDMHIMITALDARRGRVEAKDSWAVEVAAREETAQRESKGFGDSYQGSRSDLDATLIIVGKHVEVATRVIEYRLQCTRCEYRGLEAVTSASGRLSCGAPARR
jgi:hypothetical protein